MQLPEFVEIKNLIKEAAFLANNLVQLSSYCMQGIPNHQNHSSLRDATKQIHYNLDSNYTRTNNKSVATDNTTGGGSSVFLNHDSTTMEL